MWNTTHWGFCVSQLLELNCNWVNSGLWLDLGAILISVKASSINTAGDLEDFKGIRNIDER